MTSSVVKRKRHIRKRLRPIPSASDSPGRRDRRPGRTVSTAHAAAQSNSDSAHIGRRRLAELLGPHLSTDDFFALHWEQSPYLSRGTSPDRFRALCTSADFKALVTRGVLRAPQDLSATRYRDGARQDLTDRREITSVSVQLAWDHWMTRDGGSLRLLRPQAHLDGIWHALAELEEFFQCPWGANVYLTPPSSQGFSPHYDDVDVFVCQVEGTKQWRVYDGGQHLARFSSEDYGPDDKLGKLLLHTELQPGDMLYLPRGTIHQAHTTTSTPTTSLHVTLSTGQRWTWADLLELSFRPVLAQASADHEALRAGLPRAFAQTMGVAPPGRDAPPPHPSLAVTADGFQRNFRAAAKALVDKYPLDAVADMMAVRFLRERLPPSPALLPAPAEKRRPVKLSSQVRMVFRGAARMAMDEDGETPVLVHCMDNLRSGDGLDGSVGRQTCLAEEAGAVDAIFRVYPGWVAVRDLPLESKEDRKVLVEGLQEIGVVLVRNGG